MAPKTFHTPALAAYAAGRPVEPIGYVGGRPVYPIAGGAEDVVDPNVPAALPDAEALQAMSPEDVVAAQDAALAEGRELAAIPAADLTDEQIERMTVLADFSDVVDAEVARRDAEAAERAERATAAAERFNRPDPEEGDPAEPAEPADPAEGAEPAEPAEPAQPQAVAAGAGSPTRAAARRTAPRPAQRRQPTPQAAGRGSHRYSLVAAADVGSGIQAGQTLDGMGGLVEAFRARSRSFPQGRSHQTGVRMQHQVAEISRNHQASADGLWHGNPDFNSVQDLLQAASQESRLPGGSLLNALAASGGWCAPSETMYGLTSMETADGILDLPTVGVDRGGISYTPGPDFGDIFATAGFHQTEAQAIAGETKNCVEVDCPDFSEVRLDAVGYCVKAPLLTRTAYPEVIQRWLEGTIIANQHKVAGRIISGMRTALGAPIAPVLTGTPLTWGLLTLLELVIEGQRQAYRLADGQTLEVVAPRWLRVAIRADLANRAAVGAASVSNEQIASHFADRGARIQWVLNYQELANPKTVAAFPATVEVMVYPAGTFVKGEADVVNLDTVYDTADLQTNVYTAAFVEDGVLLAKMQHGGARIQVPVNPSGIMGALQVDDPWGGAQVENAGAAAA